MKESKKELGKWSIIVRGTQAILLHKLVTVEAGKTTLKGALRTSECAMPDSKKGSLQLCVSNTRETHVLWTEKESGAIRDDIIVSRHFSFCKGPQEGQVVLCNERAKEERQAEMDESEDDFYVDGRTRQNSSYRHGYFRVTYWLSREVDREELCERLNEHIQHPAHVPVSRIELEIANLVQEGIYQQLEELKKKIMSKDFSLADIRPKAKEGEEPRVPLPVRCCQKCRSEAHYTWQCRQGE